MFPYDCILILNQYAFSSYKPISASGMSTWVSLVMKKRSYPRNVNPVLKKMPESKSYVLAPSECYMSTHCLDISSALLYYRWIPWTLELCFLLTISWPYVHSQLSFKERMSEIYIVISASVQVTIWSSCQTMHFAIMCILYRLDKLEIWRWPHLHWSIQANCIEKTLQATFLMSVID